MCVIFKLAAVATFNLYFILIFYFHLNLVSSYHCAYPFAGNNFLTFLGIKTNQNNQKCTLKDTNYKSNASIIYCVIKYVIM